MEDITRPLTSDELTVLPMETLSLPVSVFDSNSDPRSIAEACAQLKQATVLGFDTETRPSFAKGQNNKVALVQISNHDRVYLFRLNTFKSMEALDPLVNIVNDPSLLKVGIGIADDAKSLFVDYGWKTNGFLDLRRLTEKRGMVVGSLSKVYAMLYGKRISKGQRLSDWEKKELTEAQIVYAALDAYVGLKIFDALAYLYDAKMREKAIKKAPIQKRKRSKGTQSKKYKNKGDGAKEKEPNN